MIAAAPIRAADSPSVRLSSTSASGSIPARTKAAIIAGRATSRSSHAGTCCSGIATPATCRIRSNSSGSTPLRAISSGGRQRRRSPQAAFDRQQRQPVLGVGSADLGQVAAGVEQLVDERTPRVQAVAVEAGRQIVGDVARALAHRVGSVGERPDDPLGRGAVADGDPDVTRRRRAGRRSGRSRRPARAARRARRRRRRSDGPRRRSSATASPSGRAGSARRSGGRVRGRWSRPGPRRAASRSAARRCVPASERSAAPRRGSRAASSDAFSAWATA